jgi:hypothetical protein
MRARRLLSVFALALVGCIEPVKPSRELTGFITATTVDLGAGPAYGLTFVGAFYRKDDLDFQLQPLETCAGYFYDASPSAPAVFPAADAGARLFTQVSGREDTLFKQISPGFETYELTSVGSVPHTPGDTLTVNIPGTVTEFPPQTVRVRTAEPFVLDAIPSPASGDPMNLTWTAAPAPGSAMFISLRYNSTGTSDDPDTQILCAFTDDGSGTVDAGYTSAWIASSPTSRSVASQRLRHTRVDIDTRTKVFLLSVFDLPTPVGTP